MSERSQKFRLNEGGLVDHTVPVPFRFEGRDYTGLAGDTLASALLANGVRLVGRSFKYHRPRGIIGFGPEEPNALIQFGKAGRSTPNMRATEIPLHAGLDARAVNCWPNVRFDVGGINNLLSRFLAAGFYYKTFMWPHWHLYEWAIRRAAGLGKVAEAADCDRYETRHAHCDVLVVGSGPAGLAAARAAAAGGARVILAEQDSVPGGKLLWEGGEVEGIPSADWATRIVGEIGRNPEATVMTRTVVTGYFDHNALTMIETVTGDDPQAPDHLPRYRHWQVRARQVVLAAGSIERPLVFPGNDRPGIMLASAVRHYIARYAVRPGNVAVIFANNNTAYRTASAFCASGGRVAAVIDTRSDVSEDLLAAMEALAIPVLRGAHVVATRGSKALREVIVRDQDGARTHFACDLLAMSGGDNPNVQLFSQSGGKLAYDSGLAAFRPDRSVQNEQSVGAAAGLATLEAALSSGHAGGSAALRKLGFPGDCPPAHATLAFDDAATQACWSVDRAGKAFVDMQHDVCTSDIELAARENFVSLEHLKRYTTLGMASDQGKTSNVNALAIMAQLTGKSIPEVGTTRFRFPYVATALGAFAGRAHGALLRPLRRLPLHDLLVGSGAVMEDFGGWLRPAFFPQPGERRHDAERREALTVRNMVGLFEGSPLGKIEVRGPDAARFLDFIYASRMSSLAVGKIRYGLMLNELGVIIDDGVCARLGDDHFLLGTSSAGAERIAGWLEEWLQCEFTGYNVLVAPITTSWAVITLTGPYARAVLSAAGPDFPVSSEEFPHMSLRQGTIAGIPVRVARVSFTGEISFEINLQTPRAADMWKLLSDLGEKFGIGPIGIDAWNLLRLEKGYLHIGGDTDGTSTPLNVGWDHIMRRKDDFVGKRSLMLPIHSDPQRLQLVGLEAGSSQILPIGAHLVAHEGGARRSDGFVTSSAFSPGLGRGVAMAMVHAGRSRIGETVTLLQGTQKFSATVIEPVCYDPEGARLNG